LREKQTLDCSDSTIKVRVKIGGFHSDPIYSTPFIGSLWLRQKKNQIDKISSK